MYYCRSCGYRSEGDFCTNRKCKNYGKGPTAGRAYNPQQAQTNFQSMPFNAEDNGLTHTTERGSVPRNERDIEYMPHWEQNFQDPRNYQNNNPYERNRLGNAGERNRLENAGDRLGNAGFEKDDGMRFDASANDSAFFDENGRKMNTLKRCKMPFVPCNDQLMLAFSLVPFQQFTDIMPLRQSLQAGTIFAELNMPYVIRKRLGVN